ncbi:MAG TPA: hypothetical protein VHB25_18505 [Gemmatimonadaceae bacterium]|nr:hypothetical protein [Gemmatimonadaceae bacterium]
MRRASACISILAALATAACAKEDASVRGHGLSVASLPASTQARVYEAAARGSFDIDDPSLSLLLDGRLLPRGIGLASGGELPDAVKSAMRRNGAVKGTCEPPLQGVVGTAHCKAALPGYVVRFSPVFQIAGDTVEVYLYAQKYDTPSSGISETLRFERAYKIVGRGDRWHAVAEGSIPKEVRGEPR